MHSPNLQGEALGKQLHSGAGQLFIGKSQKDWMGNRQQAIQRMSCIINTNQEVTKISNDND